MGLWRFVHNQIQVTMLFNITQISFIALSLVCVLLIYRTLQLSGRTPEGVIIGEAIPGKFILLVLLWTIAVSVLAYSGFLSDFSMFPPKMFIVLLIPLVLIIWALTRPKTTQLLANIPPQWLLYVQSFRFIVELLLWALFIDNRAPVQMTFEGFNYDILVGITGPIVGYYCFVKKTWSKKVAIIWNFAGILILLNILVIAVLSMPTPMRVFMNDPANTIVAQFPIVLLPAILVPIAYSMHLFSLKQLMTKEKAQ